MRIVARFQLASFEAWLAWLALYAGLSYFVPLPSSGSAAAVQAVLPSIVVAAWSAMYALGGLLVLVGLGTLRPRVEAPGLCLICAGVTVSTIALLGVGGSIVPTLVLQGTLAVAAAARLRVLWAL